MTENKKPAQKKKKKYEKKILREVLKSNTKTEINIQTEGKIICF